MSISIGTGISNKLDSFQAGREAAITSHRNLGSPCDFIFVFASTIFDQQELFRGIKSVFEKTPVIGCSSPAQVSSIGLAKDSVVVFSLKSDTIKFSMGLGEKISQNARLAGQKAAKEALKTQKTTRQLFIMFPDGFTGDGYEVIRGAQDIFGTSFPIIGGSAGDNFKFQNSFQYFNGAIYQDSISGILFGGNIKFGIGVKHSWLPIGKPHKVTKSSANIIKELDNKPAAEIYEDYFEKKIDQLGLEEFAKLAIMYPLGVTLKGEDKFLIRYPIRPVEYGWLILPAGIEEGSEVQLMIGDKTAVLESAKEATYEAIKKVKTLTLNIEFILIFSSAARLKLLAMDAREEINLIKDIVGNNVPIIGFYTYGEQVPLLSDVYKGQSHFQSHTIMVVAVGE